MHAAPPARKAQMTQAPSRDSVIDLARLASARNAPSDAIFEDTRREQLSELGVTGKAFMILELITRAAKPISISEIIRTTGLTKPTAHRVVNMLVEMGFVERDATQTGFVEGQHLFTLALQALVGSAPRSLRHSILQEIVAETGETCNYGTLSGSEVIYLDRVESKWPLGPQVCRRKQGAGALHRHWQADAELSVRRRIAMDVPGQPADSLYERDNRRS